MRLKRARKAAGLSRNRLSLTAGLSSNTAADIEAGRRVPGIDTVEKLAVVLKLSPCWLAHGVEQAWTEPDTLSYLGIGQRLKEERGRQHLSLGALGAASASSDVTVLHIEEGKNIPLLDTVERLAAALKVSPCWLAYGTACQRVPVASSVE